MIWIRHGWIRVDEERSSAVEGMGRIFEFSDGWNEAWERGEVNL